VAATAALRIGKQRCNFLTELVSGHYDPENDTSTGQLAIPVQSLGIVRKNDISRFLSGRIVFYVPGVTRLAPGSALLGWGRKPSGLLADKLAQRFNLKSWHLEDGFLRSVSLGKGSLPLSIVIDDQGVYYDASSPSRLERLIAQALNQCQKERASRLARQWVLAGVSKYNHLPDYQGPLPERFVLVADQTFGDASISFGQASEHSFAAMLDAACKNHPEATVLVKVHPDVMAGLKRGHFEIEALRQRPGVEVLATDCHPASLLDCCEAVYTVTSQIGFEALLRGRPVYTFGMPFYAGWGLTVDALEPPSRRGAATLEQLVHAALITYPRYWHPETQQGCDVERLIDWMGLQRCERARQSGQFAAVGFSIWKRPIVSRFFAGASLRFVRTVAEVGASEPVIVWGNAEVPAQHKAKVIRLEDGFIRSVGLGADLVQPLSWVRDSVGMYYDSRHPSELEQTLQQASFKQTELERAEKLRIWLVERAITKYNLAAAPWQRPNTSKAVILVPGQVETDASIRFGSPEIKSNMGLLQAVREQNPGAYVVYKPHPDVVAGLRSKGAGEQDAQRWCDEVLHQGDMAQLLGQVDEVHTLTSLTGFEALLRGIPVCCYGQPFYSGWGLTVDKAPVARRTRQLTLAELVAGALIRYPTYVSGVSGRFTTPERAIEEIGTMRQRQKPDGWVARGYQWLRRRLTARQ